MPLRGALAGPRLLLRRLREVMAEPVSPQARLDKIVVHIASNMVAEVCSVYVLRSDGRLELFATEGLNRKEMGREAFLERVWQWKEQYGSRIGMQIRRLGASCDWERERFTLDEQLSRAVAEAFVTLHERGLVYRGTYMVNWAPTLHVLPLSLFAAAR